MRAGGGHVDGERRNGVRRQRADRRDRLNAGLEGGHAANLSRGAHASVICQERERGGGGGEGQPAFLGRSGAAAWECQGEPMPQSHARC